MEDGLGADVSNSQTVRVRPLSRQGIQDYGLRTCRDPDEIGWYHGAYKGSVCLVTLYALLESLPGLSGLAQAKALVSITPLSAYGFGWIVPFLIGLVAGSLLWSFRRPAVETADV